MRKLIALLWLLVTPVWGQKFYPDDPVLEEPPPLSVEAVRPRKVSDIYDLFLNTLGEPGERHPSQGLPIRARSINTLDEVPNSAWFTNRIGAGPMSIGELTSPPSSATPPAGDTWTILGGKTEGVTPGLRIRDNRGETYFLKFDPVANPEMTTAAEVIGSHFFRALGYNVPATFIVRFRPEQLQISKDATFTDESGRLRHLSRANLRLLLKRVARQSDGKIRAAASQLVPGDIIGPFRFAGTRRDDPNDTVPHEHRRELRGLHVFAAWLNHNDLRALNTLDTVVEENGQRFVRHYLIDFGAILGSASIVPNTARDGNQYFYQFRPAFAQIVTLGAYVPHWARARYVAGPSIGRLLDSRDFNPERWRPNYPNPALQNRLPSDNFWAAKKVLAFSEEQIRAMVGLGEYSDPADEDLIVRYLLERQRRIGQVYLEQVLPLTEFRVENGRIRFANLAVKYRFKSAPTYAVQWSRFNNESADHTPIEGEYSFCLPAALREANVNSYFAITIRESSAAARLDPHVVVVYLRKEPASIRIVGLERAKST